MIRCLRAIRSRRIAALRRELRTLRADMAAADANFRELFARVEKLEAEMPRKERERNGG